MHRANHNVGGVLLFEMGMRVEIGLRATGIRYGVKICTPSRWGGF